MRLDDEGVLDPWVEDWLRANPLIATPFDDLSPDILALARSDFGAPPTREIATISDSTVEHVPIRHYEPADAPTGLIVYFHGGGFCVGSIGLMDNVARELAHATGAAVISVGYRLAPEHPYPAGLEDCETVTRWALANSEQFGTTASRVVVAGESAGGNLAAVVALRLRDHAQPLAGQILVYPVVDGEGSGQASRTDFDGIVLNASSTRAFWGAYTAGRDLADDPWVAPLRAESLAGVAPAIVVLGGCDLLRDEGRQYARRLGDAAVPVAEHCYAGQPHGFVNFGFPAAADAFERIGEWARARFDACS